MNYDPGTLVKRYGPVEYEYGRFHLRRPLLSPVHLPDPSLQPLFDQIVERNLDWSLFLLLGPGETFNAWSSESGQARVLGEGDEVLIGGIAPGATDLLRVMCQIALLLERDKKALPILRAHLQELCADLRQQKRGTGTPADDERRGEDDATSLADQIVGEEWSIGAIEAEIELVERALAELTAQDPEINLAEQLEGYRQELANRSASFAAMRRRELEWWNRDDRRRNRARADQQDQVVAHYGRFRLVERLLTKQRSRAESSTIYEIQVIDGPPLLWVAPTGTPATSSLDRESTMSSIRIWLRLLEESIELGRQALGTAKDDALATRIRDGLREREAQYELVSQALGEIEHDGADAQPHEG